MEERNRYLYGSSVPAYPERPVKRELPEKDRQPSVRRKRKRKVDILSVIIVFGVIIAAYFSCFFYLQTRDKADSLNRNVTALENKIVELEKQNAALHEKIDDSVDLTKIYNIATKKLGMVHAKDNQVFSYDSRKGNQIKQHGNIPSN